MLLQLRVAGVWPHSDPYLFAALSPAGLFAPIVLLEALSEIPAPLRALWTGIVAAARPAWGFIITAHPGAGTGPCRHRAGDPGGADFGDGAGPAAGGRARRKYHRRLSHQL